MFGWTECPWNWKRILIRKLVACYYPLCSLPSTLATDMIVKSSLPRVCTRATEISHSRPLKSKIFPKLLKIKFTPPIQQLIENDQHRPLMVDLAVHVTCIFVVLVLFTRFFLSSTCPKWEGCNVNVYVGRLRQWQIPRLDCPPQLLGNEQLRSTLYVAMTENLWFYTTLLPRQLTL